MFFLLLLVITLHRPNLNFHTYSMDQIQGIIVLRFESAYTSFKMRHEACTRLVLVLNAFRSRFENVHGSF